ncbi:MAG: KR prefix domain-containing protein [Legionella sp.]
MVVNNTPAVERTEIIAAQDWLYTTQWQNNPQSTASPLAKEEGQWLVFTHPESIQALKSEFGAQSCIYCFASEQFIQINPHAYSINPTQKADYEHLFQTIHAEHEADLKGVIYWCSPFSTNTKQESDPSLHLLYLFKAMSRHSWSQQFTFCLASHTAQQVNATDTIALWQHHLWSITRIFAAEQANYQVVLLDLDAHDNLYQNAKILVQ